MNDKILLTISILISDRPDTVEKCLQSLDSLRKNVSCELILTDTGCGDKVRAIIERYADVILEFEWCRDFAKARNLGLDAARGEWFLYLDDDEWFEDTKEIEEFFNQGIYKKYGMALYLQRNYGNLKGTVYSDATVSRMVRLDEGVCMQYSIHESFKNLSGPAKLLKSYVHHYGYIYKNTYEKYRHSQRNVVPLLEEHNKAPHNLRHNVQLAQEYIGIGEYLKSIEISLKGIEDFRVGESVVSYLNSLFVNVVNCYMHMYQYEDVITTGLKYIEDERLNRLGMAKISTLIGKAAFELEQYERCVKFTDVYLKIYEDYRKNEDWYIGQAGLFLHNCFDEKMLYEVLSYGISANLKLKNFAKAKKIFEYIDLETQVLSLNVVLLKNIVEAYVSEKITEEHPCVYIINKLLAREQLQNKIIEFFEEVRKENPDMVKNNFYKWRFLQEKCWYISYLQLAVEAEDKAVRERSFCELWEKPEKILNNSIKLGIWELAEEASVDMDSIIGCIPYFKWKNAVMVANQVMGASELAVLNGYIETKCGNALKQKRCWEQAYVKRKLDVVEEEKVSEQEVIAGLDKFSEMTISSAREVYKEEVMQTQREMLPADIQAALGLAQVKSELSNGKYVQAIRILREVRELMPSLGVAIKVYTIVLEKWMQQQEKEAQSAKEEMQQLERNVKAKIQDLMQAGECVTALQLILQLEVIVGNSEELDVWKQMCSSE